MKRSTIDRLARLEGASDGALVHVLEIPAGRLDDGDAVSEALGGVKVGPRDVAIITGVCRGDSPIPRVVNSFRPR